MATEKRTQYRDSNNGQWLSKPQTERKNPATWEKERINHPSKPKGK
jgi:hypothetical protein